MDRPGTQGTGFQRAEPLITLIPWSRVDCGAPISRPHLVFCGLPSFEPRVKTETQLKCQVLFCFKCSRGPGRGFQLHHKHLQGPHSLAGHGLLIGQPLQIQNVAEFPGSRKGEFLGGPGKH